MELDAQIGANVRRMREANGWSAAQLADRLNSLASLNFRDGQVIRLEQGERRIRAGEIAVLAMAFGVSIPTLFVGDEPLEPPFDNWQDGRLFAEAVEAMAGSGPLNSAGVQTQARRRLLDELETDLATSLGVDTAKVKELAEVIYGRDVLAERDHQYALRVKIAGAEAQGWTDIQRARKKALATRTIKTHLRLHLDGVLWNSVIESEREEPSNG